ncbi:MAG TPA: TetR/AcrR family transcriptional regulator, partial [Terriglobales bacterium]
EYDREYFFEVWRNWTNWATTNPEKRKALAQLNVSDEILPETRAAAHKAMRPLGEVLERSRAAGPMCKVPISFVSMLLNSVAEGTMEYMVQDPKNAKKHCKVGFDAVWRMIA